MACVAIVQNWDWGCNLLAGCMPSMCMALYSIITTINQDQTYKLIEENFRVLQN